MQGILSLWLSTATLKQPSTKWKWKCPSISLNLIFPNPQASQRIRLVTLQGCSSMHLSCNVTHRAAVDPAYGSMTGRSQAMF